MQRVLRDTQATLTVTFEVDGVATDPSPATATVTITRADGTVLVTSAATTRTAIGKFTYTLSTTQTASLDSLTAAWTSSLGTITTTVEITGGFLFVTSEARQIPPLNDTAKYPADRIIAMRTVVEDALERACGVAFVPRYARIVLSGNGSTILRLGRPGVIRVVSVTEDGATIPVGDLRVTPRGIYRPSWWMHGYSNYVVEYEHGYAEPPGRVKQAALLLAKNWLVAGPLDDRTTSFSSGDGTFTLATPGLRGSTFGIPEVDAVVAQYRVARGIQSVSMAAAG